MRLPFVALSALALLLAVGPSVVGAEDAAPSGSTPAANGEPQAAGTPAAEELTPEEKAEKDARKACKAEICDILASRDPNGPDVACDIVKTWREAAITKMLGGKIDWPWGKAICQSKLELKRGALVKAMTEPKYDVVLPLQKLSCTLAQKDEGEPYKVEVSIAPKVSFDNGKAVEARLNWGEASAPMLVYALIYAGTGLDNQANVLGPEVVRMVNEFTTKKCTEVKAEASTNKQN